MKSSRKLEHSGISAQHNTAGNEINFTKGEGGRVKDTNGNWYIDFCLGHGPVILGHSHKAFIDRIKDSLNNGIMLPSFTSIHDEYLERLLKHTKHQLHAVYLKTGSEALTGAFKISQMHTGKLGIVRCGFLGWHDAQIASSISWHQPVESLGRKKLKYTESQRGVSGDEAVFNWVDLKLESLEKIIHEHEDIIGTFAIDAYQAYYMSKSTLLAAVKLCKSKNITVVFDETKTGGRVGFFGIADDLELDPDLRIMGKALANGFPISMIFGNEDYIKLARKLRIGGTFSKEIITVNAALTTLDIMEKENGHNRISEIGLKINDAINKGILHSKIQEFVSINPVFDGSMFDIVVLKNSKNEKLLRESLKATFLENGILILDGHPSYVCLQHEEIDIDELIEKSTLSFVNWANKNESELIS